MNLDARTLPAAFRSQMQTLLGADSEAFFKALEQASPVSLRLNPAKFSSGQEDRLPARSTETVPWCPWGRYLDVRPSFTLDPAFHAGAYYVQEASSMFLWTVMREALGHLDTTAPLTALDLCAAPGGKSTLLLDALPEGSVLVANEVQRQRAFVLAENLAKWGHPETIVTQADPAAIGALFPTAAFPGGAFDLLLTDVPCSGEGMFRKEPDALRDWSPAAVSACRERQRDILQAVWPALRPGGLLIYSTCTYNLAENEENVRWIAEQLGAGILGIDVEGLLGGSPSALGLSPSFDAGLPATRFLPHRSRGEGLFMALLQKDDRPLQKTARRPDSGRERRKEQRPPVPAAVAEAISWLGKPGKGQAAEYAALMLPDGTYTAASPLVADIARLLMKNRLPLLSAGVALGQLKGRDLAADTALALSTALDPHRLPCHELDREQALRFLRREALTLPADLPKGLVLVSWKGLPLGFVRQLGSRANNLYPAQWRIRSNIG